MAEKFRHGKPEEVHIPPAEFSKLTAGWTEAVDAARLNTAMQMLILHAAKEFASPPDLSPTQELIWAALTSEYKSAKDIAKLSGVDDAQVRRELPNMVRMEIVEHQSRVGYRRKVAG